MPAKQWIGLTVFVLLVVVLAIFLRGRPPEERAPSAPPVTQAEPPISRPEATQQEPLPTPPEETAPPVVPLAVVEVPEEGIAERPPVDPPAAVPEDLAATPTSVGAVEVRATEVLATVNGAAITLSDLVAASTNQAVQLMSAEDYELRLASAIERSLVSQVARKEGVILTENQESNVEAIRQRQEADVERNRLQGMSWTSVTQEQIEFEANRAASILLQQNLLSKAGAPPLQPAQADVEAHYLANRDRFGELPADPTQRDETWQRVYMEVRQELDPQFLENYLAWQTMYMDTLKKDANIVVNAPAN